MRLIFLVFLTLLNAPAIFSETWFWPTPNQAFYRGEGPEAFIQPTATGLLESGLFGCTRRSGARFHEGIDLFPLQRDRQGEPIDPIYAALSGRIVHINRVAGHSSYGRYIVLEHVSNGLTFYTLYAHMRDFASNLHIGQEVEGGYVLGRMGRSAGGYTIPRERAHLHFEIGFRLSGAFQEWFDGQDFVSRNHHGNWNGMNLRGIDPLDFLNLYRLGIVDTLLDYINQLPVAFGIRLHYQGLPELVALNPSLWQPPSTGSSSVAWDINFTAYGVPISWVPRLEEDIERQPEGTIQLLHADPTVLNRFSCRQLLSIRKETPAGFVPGATLLQTLELILLSES